MIRKCWLTNKNSKVVGTVEAILHPNNAALHTQLFNFQKERERLAIVVDEYGEIEAVTIDDILEIVGNLRQIIFRNFARCPSSG